MKCPGHGTATLAKACSAGFRGCIITARAPDVGLDIARTISSLTQWSEGVVHFDAVMFDGYVLLREFVAMRALLFQLYTALRLRRKCVRSDA